MWALERFRSPVRWGRTWPVPVCRTALHYVAEYSGGSRLLWMMALLRDMTASLQLDTQTRSCIQSQWAGRGAFKALRNKLPVPASRPAYKILDDFGHSRPAGEKKKDSSTIRRYYAITGPQCCQIWVHILTTFLRENFLISALMSPETNKVTISVPYVKMIVAKQVRGMDHYNRIRCSIVLGSPLVCSKFQLTFPRLLK